MDFSLTEKDVEFDNENYFPAVIEEFKASGRDVLITKKSFRPKSNRRF